MSGYVLTHAASGSCFVLPSLLAVEAFLATADRPEEWQVLS